MLHFQNSQGSSQPSISPVPEDLMLFFNLHVHQACMWLLDIHAVQALIRIKMKTNKYTKEKIVTQNPF